MLRLTAVALAVALVACGGSLREGEGSVEYSVSARQNYERGIKRLKEEEYVDAIKYFSFVKARFPYSKYAVLAELRLADAAFGMGAFLQAIDAYKLFIKFHPTHEMVQNGYAPYRIAESYYKMLPDDWLLVPPSYEKDMGTTLDCLREFEQYLKKYPGSPYVKRAEPMRNECSRRLAAHEWYVANFYWDRKKPMGTVMRLRTLLRRYPGSGYDKKALWLLGRAYLEVGRHDDAKKTFEELLEKYPDSARAGDARRELARLSNKTQ